MRHETLRTVFVETMPETLEEGVLYISQTYQTSIHLCACGCGYSTVVPFNHANWWSLTLNGDSVTLHPSIGNGVWGSTEPPTQLRPQRVTFDACRMRDIACVTGNVTLFGSISASSAPVTRTIVWVT
jgi:hypothetical protein